MDPSARSQPVTLAHVAMACLMFDSLTRYNESLSELYRTAHGRLDLSLSTHREALLKWLNEWGCRHLSKEQHRVASESILLWYEENAEKLESVASPLWGILGT